MMKKLSAALLSVIMLFSVLAVSPFNTSAATVKSEAVYSGNETEYGYEWSFEDGTLTLSGDGATVQNVAKSIGVVLKSQTKHIIMEYGIKKIKRDTFPRWPNLESVIIPESVEEIEPYAFANSPKLNGIRIPGSVKSIGFNAFQNCEKMEYAIIENGVESIGNKAFYRCYELKSLTLSNTLNEIGVTAFESCAIQNLTIPGSVKKIDRGAFEYCNKLENLVILDGAERIEESAFNECFRLKSVFIPESVTYIDYSAFKYIDDFYYWVPITPEESSSEPGTVSTSEPIFVIYGIAGSTAETFANEHKLDFCAIDPDADIGDTNDDGNINVLDVTTIQKHLANIVTLEGKTLFFADMNMDSKVDVNDVTAVQKCIAKLPYR